MIFYLLHKVFPFTEVQEGLIVRREVNALPKPVAIIKG